MQKPIADPKVANMAPVADQLTAYDEQHFITYLRLLNADADGADWKEVAKMVLQIDPGLEPDRAHRAWETYLTRAQWLAEHGYRHLLRGGAPN
ncbi:DUF2285 domain-containing protein [Tardiphaga sp. OK245]|uniref:DNA -binding domain-containing protein n=1 Tax=Tardiphaga sp. OK245 TaxID=1855306 RepID=UPI0008A7D5D0|nr:DUF2285 domain-containing protein [Tardiphaga sp. OK245]SEH40370.1 Uncharacterized conserved protein [Tardiphaga sp. OK245]